MSLNVKGTVKFIDLEGGFFGIIGEDGTKYNPKNLPEDYKKDGLKVQFEAEKVSGMSARMWGTLVRIVSIKKNNSNVIRDTNLIIIGIFIAAVGGILGAVGGIIAASQGLLGAFVAIIGVLTAAIGGMVSYMGKR